MGWKNWPVWLKGLIVGFFLGFLLIFIIAFIQGRPFQIFNEILFGRELAPIFSWGLIILSSFLGSMGFWFRFKNWKWTIGLIISIVLGWSFGHSGFFIKPLGTSGGPFFIAILFVVAYTIVSKILEKRKSRKESVPSS